MNLALDGKVAVVTGASRGIGRAIALRLSEEGVRLVIAARTGKLLDEVASACKSEVLPMAIDLRDMDAPGKLIQAAITHYGKLDALVNNAGATKRGDFLELSEADWQDGFALKFYAAVRCARAAWPHLRDSKGSMTSIIGIGGRTGSAEFAIGGSVNAALMNLTKVLADRGIKDGIRVNAINPGSIATERLQVRINKYASDHGLSADAAAVSMAESMGIARFGQPNEIADVVAFLMSPSASYCQGCIMDIDGGQTHTL